MPVPHTQYTEQNWIDSGQVGQTPIWADISDAGGGPSLQTLEQGVVNSHQDALAAYTLAVAAIPAPASPSANDVLYYNGSIWTKGKLQDASVQASSIGVGKLTPGTAGQVAVVSGGVSTWGQAPTAGIADAAVTTIKIADGNVTAAKMATLSVATAALQDNAVTTAKIADNNVTSAKIATDAVGATQIAANAVGSSELADNAVDAAAIQAGVVGYDKLAKDWSGFFATGSYAFAADQATRIISGITNVTVNNGTCYDGNSTFTAPGNGVYFFYFNFYAGFGSDSYINLQWLLNGATWFGATNGYLSSAGDQTEGLMNTLVMYMTTGQTMQVGGWSSVGGTVSTRFAGFRIPIL